MEKAAVTPLTGNQCDRHLSELHAHLEFESHSVVRSFPRAELDYQGRTLRAVRGSMLLAIAVVVAFLLLAVIRWRRRRRPLSRTSLPLWKDRRRGHRVALTTPVFVYGWLADEPFSESTETLDVSGNGGLIRLSEPLNLSQELILTNLQTNEDLTCRVARTARMNDGTILAGLHFLRPSPRFWQIDFVTNWRRTERPPSPDEPSHRSVAS